ncbi:hypothetical protein MesoLjLc_45890 [Mesorhizobium sp. L-8-10]|uniref:Rap1a/Tai family immunity protein n=1 Tax=Mesorhizobium sp. L-8-10 TaxID=2744523 RepID=UPI001937E0C6|nr:Rap1a/Tai family immunity protein [Mesorhizobium sp. L-8-10]BCH32659.1 hypothetical protein MesoLjLc_45890 [Mesorhizobium sp. L-8-10]
MASVYGYGSGALAKKASGLMNSTQPMMTKYNILVLVGLTMSLTMPALAQERATYFFNGNQLYELCRSDRGEAQAYILGFNDATALRDEVNNTATFCPPLTVKSGQFVDAVCQELERNPADRHWQAAFIVLSAIQKAWPCPQ